MFVGLGLSGVIPVIHLVITDGFYEAFFNSSVCWLVLMAFLYIFGAFVYAIRVPERIWPGKFDIWVSDSDILQQLSILRYQKLCCTPFSLASCATVRRNPKQITRL